MKGTEMKVQVFQTSVITDTDTPRPKRGLGVLGKTAGCAQEGYVTADAYGPPAAGKYIHCWTLNNYTVFGWPRLPATAAAGRVIARVFARLLGSSQRLELFSYIKLFSTT